MFGSQPSPLPSPHLRQASSVLGPLRRRQAPPRLGARQHNVGHRHARGAVQQLRQGRGGVQQAPGLHEGTVNLVAVHRQPGRQALGLTSQTARHS